MSVQIHQIAHFTRGQRIARGYSSVRLFLKNTLVHQFCHPQGSLWPACLSEPPCRTQVTSVGGAFIAWVTRSPVVPPACTSHGDSIQFSVQR